MDIKVRLGRRIRAFRELTGLSQEQLAQSARLSRVFVGAAERGEHAMTVESLERIALALGVTMAQLVDAEDGKKALRKDQILGARVSALAREASASEIDRFERVAKAFFGKKRGD